MTKIKFSVYLIMLFSACLVLTSPTLYARQTLWATGTGSKIDVVTGLMWQHPYSLTRFDWESAADYCSTLSLSDKSDWRLATIKELMSVRTQIVASAGLWSSSAVPGSPDRHRSMSFSGRPLNTLDTAQRNVVCVRHTSRAS